MEVLKKFVLNAATSSLTEREQLFQDLFAILGSDASKGTLMHDFLSLRIMCSSINIILYLFKK